MQIHPIQLKQSNKLMIDYRQQDESILKHFDYKPFEITETRFNDLKNRSYNRQQLSVVLKEMNANWDAPSQTLEMIDKLKAEDAFVVIGGQQAGLATGPMYTINKIISIIHFAKEQTEKWQKPIIPVFWIAGEDHDYDEINHIHTVQNKTVNKITTKQYGLLKKSVSHMPLDQDKTLAWVKEVFSQLDETMYTKDLLQDVRLIIEKSQTFVDFFARFIFMICKDAGIVLIDSANEAIRELESDFFCQLIDKQPEMAEVVSSTVQQLTNAGYTIPLDVDKSDGHLFFHDDNGERILLERLENIWNGKHDEVSLTTDQLLYIAKNHPEKLSNNVITRPLMQEYLFPTLAFIAGDGEISYWSALKEAFHIFDLKMPPVVPRLSFTFMTARMEKLLKVRGLTVADVINGNIQVMKTNWLMTKQTPPIDIIYRETNKEIEKLHAPLKLLAAELGKDLENLADSNLEKIKQLLAFLERKTKQKSLAQYEKEIGQFDELSALLKPNNVLQERVMNPLYLLNQYGDTFINQLIDHRPLSVENNHYIIKI